MRAGPTAVARRLHIGLAGLTLLAVGAGLISEQYWLALLPLGLLLVGQAILDFRPLFYLLLISIPLGTEVFLPGGFGTDLPTEPLAIGLSLILLVHAARYWPTYAARRFAHPIALLLYVHIAWIGVAALFSEHPFISLKFLLAKGWYVGAFFFLPLLLLRRPHDIRAFGHLVMWPLLFVAVQSLARHALYGFSFADQFRTMHPFMRNHVSYSACLTVFFPWVLYMLWGRRRADYGVGWVYAVIAVWLLAIGFAYTRAAYVALLLAGIAYFVIRWRLLRPALALALAAGIGVAVYLVRDNTYLRYAPDYDTTITHREFDDLISATYQLEDISTMERFYRWVAGGNMVPYRPVVGFGPGSFVETYSAYTNNNFRTYVSDNPDRSGIHNYYLMTLVEQGYIGLFFLLAFVVGSLVYGERLYHRQHDPAARAAIMAALLSLVIVAAFNLINDLLETDKVGSLFFIATALLINMGQYRAAADSIEAAGPDEV